MPAVPGPELMRRIFADSKAAWPEAAHSLSWRSYFLSLSEGPCRIGGVCAKISVMLGEVRLRVNETRWELGSCGAPGRGTMCTYAADCRCAELVQENSEVEALVRLAIFAVKQRR
jgi:hypothetical protein